MEFKRLTAFTMFLILLCAFPTFTPAQKSRSKSRRGTAAAPAPTPVPDMRPEAALVAEQIKSISKFLFVYGKIVNGLEIAEDQAKRGQVSPAVQTKNKQNRDALVASITGLKTGLDGVVKNFQANPRMQVQYLKISYAAESVATAEQLASGGQYDEAGKSLAAAVDKLTDVIMSMRLL